jgi:hypothetical protein
MFTDCLQNEGSTLEKKFRLLHSFTFFVKLLASSLENKKLFFFASLSLSLSREIIHSDTFHFATLKSSSALSSHLSLTILPVAAEGEFFFCLSLFVFNEFRFFFFFFFFFNSFWIHSHEY